MVEMSEPQQTEGGEELKQEERHILQALASLPLFDELYMRMQATNISLVDALIEPMEQDLLRELIEIERTPLPAAMMVSAVSQMWIFAVYELLRTWRQRARNLLQTAARMEKVNRANRPAELKKVMEALKGAAEDANMALDMQRESVASLADPAFVAALRSAWDEIELVFKPIEVLRVTLAKHEVPGAKGVVAMAPGYGRIDYNSGSMYWFINLKDNTMTVVNRRDIANQLRMLGIRDEPSTERSEI
jgi:hypothetical protein